jgi:AraC-like DNA-binding protein
LCELIENDLSKLILEFYLVFIAIIGIVVALYLSFNKRKHDNQYLSNLLAVIILCSSSHFIRNYLISSGWIYNFPWFYGTFSFIYLLAPPLTYLYVRGLLNDEYKLGKLDFIHLIPGVLQLILCIPYITSSKETKLKYVREIDGFNNFLNNTPFNGIPNKYFFLAVFLSVSIYAIFMLKSIKKARLNQQESFQLEIYHWARFVFLACFAMAMFMIVNAIIKASSIHGNFHLTAFGPFLWLRLILFTVVLYKIIFSERLLWGLPNFNKDSGIIKAKLKFSNNEMNDTESEKDSHRQLLTKYQANNYQLILEDFFKNQIPIYTNTRFNLSDLAKHTDIPKHHWAYFFQYHSFESFVELRNKNRVEHSKKIMNSSEYKNKTIEAIGQASGFGSRITFLNAFKKYESISPSEYLEKLKQSN